MASSIIVREEFAKETKHFYIREGGTQVAKETNHYVYFEKWDAAFDHIKRFAEHDLACLQRTVNDIKKMPYGHYQGKPA